MTDRSKLHPLFLVIGQSGAGKTNVLCVTHDMLRGKIEFAKAYTTRTLDRPLDHLFYDAITRESFDHGLSEQLFVNHERFEDGSCFANTGTYLDEMLAKCACIQAVTECEVLNLRNAGYRVHAIRIIPRNPDGTVRPVRSSRKKTDEIRYRQYGRSIPMDLHVDNYWGHFNLAANQIVTYIEQRL